MLVGRLTKDPEMKYTQSGIAVTRFTLAVNRPFKNQQGENEADFISCVAWRKQAENVANYLNKGSLVGLDGRIQTSSFDGQDGKRVFMTEVVADSVQFLEPKGSGQQQTQQQNQGNYGYQNKQQQTQQNPFNNPQQSQHTQQPQQNFNNQNNSGPIEITDDDLPF